MIRATVLASGGGSTFQAVIDACAEGLPLEIVALIANRAGAFAIERARSVNIPVTTLVWDRTTTSRAEYDRAVVASVATTAPQLVLLLGWMHLLSPEFVARFPQTINIHPAYLPLDGRADVVEVPDGTTIPAFRGAHPIADALAANSRWYGATAHYLSVEADRGAVLARAALPLVDSDAESALANLRTLERAVLLEAIGKAIGP